jgi:flavin reductase (DIM6/NTAB) family NADH-FMN oxidoreductase RutF
MATFSTEDLSPTDCYKLLTGLVVPRPIGWIGTVDAEGRSNLAPYSFFQAVAGAPPTVLFSAGTHSDRIKDSAANARDTGEFTCSIVGYDLTGAMNRTAATLPAGESEFAAAGLTPASSEVVAAPRVAEARASFECRVVHIVELGEQPAINTVVFGEVACFHVDDEVLDGTRIRHEVLDAVGRMTGEEYVTTRDRFELTRPA